MTKLSKKVMSIALAAAVSASSAFSGSATVQAETTKSESSQYAAATLTVKFKKPKDSTSTPTIYAYDRNVDANGKEIQGHMDLAGSPEAPAKMTLDSSKEWYTYDLNTHHGFAYVIITCGDNRYPKKADVTDNAFKITSSVEIDGTKTETTPVPVTSPTITSTPSSQTKEVTVHFKKPSNWSGTPTLYEYYRPEGAVAGEGQSKKELGDYPGVKMSQETSSSNWYSYTFNVHTTGKTFIQFVSSDKANRYPVKDETVTDNSYMITATSWFDPDTSKELVTKAPSSYDVKPGTSTPSASPTTTPSQVPTATPIVAEILATAKPVKGPHVTTNYGEKARFADASEEDYLYVELNLAGGATSATYTLDDGVAKTITENTVIKVGEGKIANSDITLQVTSTDGTTSNTQTFTYSKIPDYKNTVHQVLSQSMLNLFAAVETAANNTEKTYNVTFTAPSTWKGTVYAYAYYDVKNAEGKVETKKPLGIWPGKKATKNTDGTYSVDVSTSVGSANVIFANVTKEVPTTPSKDDEGNEYYDVGQCEQVPEQFKGGCQVTADSKISSDGVVTKVTAGTTPTPSTTPTAEPTLQAYFGAEKSAPQLTTTKQQLSVVASNAKGTLTYRFFVDDTELYNGSNNSIIWDPSTLKVGYHRLTVFITDTTTDGKKKSIMLTKNYVLTDIYGSTPEPTEVPTNSPEISETPGTATDIPENSQTPGDATTAPANSQTPGDATTVPVNSQTPSDATTAPVNTDTPLETVTPTATATTTQAPQTATQGAVTVTENQNAAGVVSTGSAVTGSVIFTKKGKTAGEDVTIKIATANKKSNAKYTYSYYVGSKAIAKNTTKTSATWTTSKKGTFAVKVIIYENGKQTAVASANYAVKARVITIKTLKTNKKSGQKKNTKITITAKATTKKGKVSYKFAVQKGSGAIKTIKGYSKTGKATWKPTKKGTYKLYVYVKNGKGVIVKKTKTFKVK